MAGTVPANSLRADELSGAQKCAILCMAIGAKESGRLLQQLNPEEVEMVAREIVAIPPVPPEVAAAVLKEFHEAARAAAPISPGGVAFAQQLLESAVGGTKGSAILERIQVPRAEGGLVRMKRTTPEALVGILRTEHPQTSALILAHLDMQHLSKVLQEVDPALAGELLFRIAKMDKVAPDVLDLVSSGLDCQTETPMTREISLSGGPGAVAKVLNQIRGNLQDQYLHAIEGKDHGLAGQIRSLMFTFEDLLLIDGRGIQMILRELESKELALALKAASDELKHHIKSNMSERAAEALEEEIELLGPVRVKDVEAAHSKITETARRLEQAGDILIQRAGGSDEIIA